MYKHIQWALQLENLYVIDNKKEWHSTDNLVVAHTVHAESPV